MAPPKMEGPPSKERYPGIATASIAGKGRRTVGSAVNNGGSSRDPMASGTAAEGANGQPAMVEGVDGVRFELGFKPYELRLTVRT